MTLLVAYIVPVALIIGVVILARKARARPSTQAYFLVLVPALVALFYARIVQEITGVPLGTDVIGASLTVLLILVGVGFSVWSVGYGVKSLFKGQSDVSSTSV